MDNETVGLLFVSQQTPRSVTVDAPSAVTEPPHVALNWVISVTALVVSVEYVAVVVKFI